MLSISQRGNPEAIKRMLILALMSILIVCGFQFRNNSTVDANSTTVQSIPLINKGSNAADAVAQGGESLQNAINGAKNNVVEHAKGAASDGEDEAATADRNIMGAVLGGKNDTFQNGNMKVDSTARFSDVFKVEHRVGADIVNALLYGGKYICLAMFVIGAIVLLFNVLGRGRSWTGLAILGIDCIVIFLLCNLGTIYSWLIGYSQAVVR